MIMRGSLERVPLWGGIVPDQEQYLDFSSDFLDRTMGNIVVRAGDFEATRYQGLSSRSLSPFPWFHYRRHFFQKFLLPVFSQFARFYRRSVSSSKWNQSIFISHSISSHFSKHDLSSHF